jgi:hypothetical protein
MRTSQTSRSRTTTTCLFGGALFNAGLTAAAVAQPSFTTSTFETLPNSDGYVTAVVVADLNGDDIDDFVVNSYRLGLDWYENDGMTPAGFTKQSVGPGFARHRGAVVAADLDGDGDMDLAYANSRAQAYGGTALGWYENDGFGVFTPYNSIEFIPFDSGNFNYAGFSDLHAADINSDGHMDLVATGFKSSGSPTESVVWFENDGAMNPTFSRRVVDASLSLTTRDGNGAGYGSVRVADVTNDGHADIVVGANGSIALYTSDGAMPTPSFTMSTIKSVTGLARIEIADLNNDTYPEVIYGTSSNINDAGGVLGYLSNNGATPPVLTDVPLASDGPFSAISAGDIDASGFTDFIVTRGRRLGDTNGNGAFWYDNDGATLTRRTVFAEGGMRTRWDSALMDVNNDGDLDVINATRRNLVSGFDELLFHDSDLDPALPIITTQPMSQVVTAPTTAQFAVIASGAGTLSYQWHLNGVPLVDGPAYSGALTDTLDVASSETTVGVYTCVVTNLAGSVVSAAAVLGVVPAPSICPGDLNGDGATNLADFNILANDFGCFTP